MDLSAENKGQNISRQGSEDRECCRALVMIRRIIAKLFNFDLEIKALNLKVELREAELKEAEKEIQNKIEELRAATDKIWDLEQKITDLKNNLKVESSQKNEAISLATDQKNTIEQLRTELAKIKKQKSKK